MKKFISYTFSLPLLFFLWGCQVEKNHPNVILILTDDQGWGDLSLNGNQDINLKTSNLNIHGHEMTGSI